MYLLSFLFLLAFLILACSVLHSVGEVLLLRDRKHQEGNMDNVLFGG